MMDERYYQTKKDFTAASWSIYITACCNISDLQSEEYQQYICERVFANDQAHRLLWKMAKYDRGPETKMHHMAISLQWLKDMDAREYHAIQILQKCPSKLRFCQ